MKTYQSPDAPRTATLNTQQLRNAFLIENLFLPGQVQLNYCDVDRAVVGGISPLHEPLSLGSDDALRSAYFAERREIGILNIGQAGTVNVDGQVFNVGHLDAVYIGRGSQSITFASTDVQSPAQFYLLSYPAHTAYPTTLISKKSVEPLRLGAESTCNKRALYKYIHPAGVKSCQLVMGFTAMESGSAWNTMPPHTHLRRSEIYLYFNLSADARVFHLMGEPTETRHLVVANQQAVISPSWSIHSGVGTSAYSFIWGMGGENQAFDDMDAVPVSGLR